MRFFLLLVVALAVTITWQTTIGALPSPGHGPGAVSPVQPTDPTPGRATFSPAE